jgi:hypothetical protein
LIELAALRLVIAGLFQPSRLPLAVISHRHRRDSRNESGILLPLPSRRKTQTNGKENHSIVFLHVRYQTQENSFRKKEGQLPLSLKKRSLTLEHRFDSRRHHRSLHFMSGIRQNKTIATKTLSRCRKSLAASRLHLFSAEAAT